MSGNRILITGFTGMLGSNLMNYFNADSIACNCDITNVKEIYELLSKIKPNIIIHTAAYTDVEDCEINPDKAYKINTIGTQNLVNYCIDKDILFIYISSTGIYGTKKNDNYTEFDDIYPTTIHHKSKHEAEKIVQNHLTKYLILRTGWLFGGDITHNKNFVYKRYLESVKNDKILSDNSQIGNPTYVKDFIKQIEVLILHQQYGIFNCVNEAKNISRYDYVKKIIEFFQQDCIVDIASENIFKRIAPVSKNESAINYKLNLSGLNIMKKWDIALEEYIEILKPAL